MADQFLYEASLMTDAPSSPFLKKQVVYVQDTQNTSNYTGQINLDLSQLSNSRQWIDFTSMVWEIPFVISIENKDAAAIPDMSAVVNAFVAGLKNGSHQIVNSLSVQVNNTNVVQLSNYLNHYITYKMMTSLSDSDVKKWGASTYFAPDSATSFHFDATGAAEDGPGFSNNRTSVDPATYFDFSSKSFKITTNTGFAQRMQSVLDLSDNVTDAWYNQSMGAGTLASSKASAKDNGVSYFSTPTTQTATIDILATIRFKDLANLFAEMPLVKGTYVTAVLNYNASAQTVLWDQTGPGPLTLDAPPQITGLTNPIMISSAATAQPNEWITGAAAGETTTLFVSCNVGAAKLSNGTPVTSSLIGARTRVSADLYTMNPIFEERYLSLKTRDVYYTDIYTYMYPNQIGAGQTFNFLATNGISQPTAVIVIPYVSKAGNGTDVNVNAVPIYQSPFASEPGTTSTIPITNFNIQVSGSNIFQDNFQFDYQQFLTELASINALNGGASTGLTSGLISQKDFQYGFRYLVADLSRRLPNDDVSRSISVVGKNNSAVPIDLLVIIEYRRKLTIQLDTGGFLPTM